jgi:sugar O-acyltransferase (sialic acid O-acetyltransferase NeuD family)
MKKVVVFGTGSIGQMVHYYFTNDSEFEIAAFCADADYIDEPEFMGIPVVPFETIVDSHPPAEYDMFVAIGYNNLNQTRMNKYHEAKEKGYKLVTYVCSKSVIWDNAVEIGDNCFIFENQTIQPFVKIGNNVILWSGNHIGHHSTIGDHCFLTSHVVVSGHVIIGDSSFLGVNCTLRDGLTLAPRTVVGAGAIMIKDSVEGGVYTSPAATLRTTRADRIPFFTTTKYGEKT